MQTIFIISLVFTTITTLIHGAVIVPLDTAYVKSDRVGNDFSYSIEENRGLLSIDVPILTQLLQQKPELQTTVMNKDPQQTSGSPPRGNSAVTPLQQPINNQQPKITAYVGTSLHPIQNLALTSPTATYPISYQPPTYQYAYTYPYAGYHYPIAYNLIKTT